MSDPEATSGARYRVGDVCRIADVQPYVLRYWETEFPVLGSGKQAGGPRYYSEHDLELIRRIKQLLYDEGYTIAGAKKRLDSELKGLVAAPARARDEAGAGDADAADPEPPLLVPPPVPAPPPIPKPRRARPKPPKEESAGELVFEETSLEPPPARHPALPDEPAEREEADDAEEAEAAEEAAAAPEPGPDAAAAGEEAPSPPPRARSKSRPRPQPEVTAIELASLVEPPPSFPDPRVAFAIAELKEILALLSRDPE